MRFRLDRRWAMLVVAVVLGATGGSLLGFLTAPGPSGQAQQLTPPEGAAAPTTGRPRSRVEGTSSTRPRRVAPAPTTSTARPTTTTLAPTTSTTRGPTTTSPTTTTTLGQSTTSTTSSSTSSTTSTT